MAYRLKLNEKIRSVLRRIAVEQIELAEAELAGPNELERAVHETRRCLKRLRALLRLARPGLPNRVFKRESAALRDIADLLAETRDNHVILQTIAKLEARKAGAPLMNLRRVALLEMSDRNIVEDPGRTAAALAGLRAARERFESLKLKPASLDTLLAGFERSYAHARRARLAAYRKGDSDSFHELRKHVQHHWRHTQLLVRAWPEMMEAHAATARELSQILGDDHDLAVLHEFLDRAPKGEIGRMEARLIRQAIRDRQAELRLTARPHLERLLADRPGEFRRRVERLWKAARRLKDANEREPRDSEPAARPAAVPVLPAVAESPQPGRAA